MSPKFQFLIWLFLPTLLPAQQTDLQQILDRLDHLEQENRNLAAEVHALREELADSRRSAVVAASPSATAEPPVAAAASQAAGPETVSNTSASLEDRVAVQERRVDELSQTKVEASQRLPISLTGMALFNGFLNGRANGGAQDPLIASLSDNSSGSGASLSQTIIGLRFQGPRVLGGGQVRGAVNMDLWGGTSSSLSHLLRLRVATVQIDWKNQTLLLGQNKPIVSPRDPDSLAQVAFSPLTFAGNLWLWQPQIRFEQRFAMGENSGLRAQIGVYQTSEPVASAGSEYQASLTTARPALQGRFEFWHQFGTATRIEIAPGFHASQTHVAGMSIPSRLFTADWLVQPIAAVQFTGAFFHGRNTAGLGGLRQGFTLIGDQQFRAVQATGGWAQLSWLPTQRLTFNIYGGQESDRAEDLLSSQIARNFAYAGNALYRLGSNVLLGLEASQVRTTFVGGRSRLVNHYDVALGYLF
jgi:hypothetical protein